MSQTLTNFGFFINTTLQCGGEQVAHCKNRFTQLEDNILAGLVGQVESEIDEVSPWIRFLDHIDPKADVAVVNFSMDKARACAWELATTLAPLSPSQWKRHLELRDLEMTALADLIWHPVGSIFKLGLLVIRCRESNDVARVIEVLN